MKQKINITWHNQTVCHLTSYVPPITLNANCRCFSSKSFTESTLLEKFCSSTHLILSFCPEYQLHHFTHLRIKDLLLALMTLLTTRALKTILFWDILWIMKRLSSWIITIWMLVLAIPILWLSGRCLITHMESLGLGNLAPAKLCMVGFLVAGFLLEFLKFGFLVDVLMPGGCPAESRALESCPVESPWLCNWCWLWEWPLPTIITRENSAN